jgi:alginate O-acetyltransferase complex protein AlgI
LALVLGGAIVLALFLMHKLAAPGHDIAVRSPITRLLAAVGFSYVALRSVELLRAGADRAVSPAGWLETVSYLFPFHMLAAGPIQSWAEFQRQHGSAEPLSARDSLGAVDRIVHGLFKKFVLARVVELTLLTRFTAPWPYQLIEVQAYYLWVYLDFSAYSDLAVGAGRLLGVATPENFNHPLGARNIIAFWERWHISLTSFVRRNCFIPLQLSMMRRTHGAHPMLIASFAFAVSFLLVGLWHGVSLRFLLWGAMHAAALILCNLYQRALVARVGRKGVAIYLENPVYRVLATAVTFEFVAFSLAFIVHPATAFLD